MKIHLVKRLAARPHEWNSCILSLVNKPLTASKPFSSSCLRLTDGVYRALTEMRVKTPWIEALRKREQDGSDSQKAYKAPATPQDRDLSPKKMGDSHISIVCTFDAYDLGWARLTD